MSAIGNLNFAPLEVPTERATRAPSVHGGQSSRGDQEDLRRAEQELDNFLDGGASQQEDLGDGRKLHSAKFGADPRINLTLRATKNKAQKIVNFLPEHVANRVAAKRRERMSLVEGPNGIMSIKAEAGQPGYIALGEWSAANIRLLQYLLESGELKRSEIEYYQAYSLMIYEFLEAYEWGSILNFDTRYRELQAHHGFPWGTQNQQLAASVLIPRKQPTRDRAVDSSKGKEGPRARKDEQCRLQFTRRVPIWSKMHLCTSEAQGCKKRHDSPINVEGALIPEAWERELSPLDPDRDFILNGVRHGFRMGQAATVTYPPSDKPPTPA